MESINLNPVESLIDLNKNKKTQWKVFYMLYTNIKNIPKVRQSLMKGEIQAALLNPSMIVDLFQVTVATNRALRSQFLNKMSTKSIYTEIIYNFSPTKKIANALQTFGISDKETDLLAVIPSDGTEDSVSDLGNHIDGEVVSLEKLPSLRNENAIKKLYKISDEELERGLLDSVLGRMACKDFPVI